MNRSRTQFGPAAPCSSLLLRLKHRAHSKTKAKTENKQKGSCPHVLNPHTKGPRGSRQLVAIAHECWVGGNYTFPSRPLQVYMLSPLPITTSNISTGQQWGGEDRSRSPVCVPTRGPFNACPEALPEDEVSLYSIGHGTSWLCDQLAGPLRGCEDGKGLVSPTGTSFLMQEAQPNHF